MEERVGKWWHCAITSIAASAHPESAASLNDMKKSIGIMFRAAGGSAALRVAPASAQAVGGQRRWLQKIAGSGLRADYAQLEPDVLALPAELAVFETKALNQDMYLWLAMLSAHFVATGHWVADNTAAGQMALARFPGFDHRFQALLRAQLAQRPSLSRPTDPSALAEAAVQTALNSLMTGKSPQYTASTSAITPAHVAPVWLWLHANPALQPAASSPGETPSTHPAALANTVRRRSQTTQHEQSRNAMVLPFHAESLMSWSEMVHVNRASDDEEDGNAVNAANDMDHLSVAPDGQNLASRVKFDLDLPSASADDAPLGPGLRLPEWDYRKGQLLPDHCLLQVMQTQHAAPFIPSPALRVTARQLRRRLETLRDAPRALHGQDSGDDIDLDAWVRFSADQTGQAGWHTDTPAIYTRQARHARSLATLLLADLSLSTDAYATAHSRVIDVIRDALFVFGEALHSAGDPFAIWGFSSVRRQHVRMQHLKTFSEPWGDACRARVGAIKPGYYTRMGAAIRYATRQLETRPEQRRLLMLLTDGKPNDLDVYEGRYGLEDTRTAVHEARQAGLTPFCITIDETAHDYLPMLFGQQGYAMVRRPQDLVAQLTHAWATLSQH